MAVTMAAEHYGSGMTDSGKETNKQAIYSKYGQRVKQREVGDTYSEVSSSG